MKTEILEHVEAGSLRKEVPYFEIGDTIGIFQSGAYALSASPNRFLGHPVALEFLMENGQATPI